MPAVGSFKLRITKQEWKRGACGNGSEEAHALDA